MPGKNVFSSPYKAARIFCLAQLMVLCLTFSVFAQSDKDPGYLSVYNKAIYDSAVYEFSDLRPLLPLKFDPATKTATVATLTSYNYQMGTTTLSRDVWVSGYPEVQNICKTYPKDELEMSLRQLLGLSPASMFTSFVTFEVKSADVFRPTTNPDTQSTMPCACPITPTCGEAFPAGVSDTHVKWIANQMLSSYVITESTLIPVGYPWTRLGYTYNWRPGANKYGASEYVIRSGSTVQVTAITPYTTYCGQ
jgi:hypothetical protein